MDNNFKHEKVCWYTCVGSYSACVCFNLKKNSSKVPLPTVKLSRMQEAQENKQVNIKVDQQK